MYTKVYYSWLFTQIPSTETGFDKSPVPRRLVPAAITVMTEEGEQDEDANLNSFSQIPLVQDVAKKVFEAQTILEVDSV